VYRLRKANHLKRWDAKLLAYLRELLPSVPPDTVAGLPGERSLSLDWAPKYVWCAFARGTIMKRLFFPRILLGLWGLLFLSIATAHAQFLIEFTDGRRMQVPSYKEEGEKVRVYTPSGSFAFRKSDIKRVVTLGERAVTTETEGKPITEPCQQVVVRKRPEPLPLVAEAVVEKTVAEPQPDGNRTSTDQLWDSLRQVHIWSIMDFVKSWLYQVRYLIGLLAFGKLLKLFLIGSVR
jgi:hypothetical protein